MSITLWQHYKNLGARISRNALSNLTDREGWEAGREALHREFMISIGLDPLPPRCDLKVATHGTVAGAGYRAEKISYQFLPDCWGTGVVFRPDPMPKAPCPAVLYACGHSDIGVVGYEKNGIMWARRGYVCLIFDTIEQHDNRGEHHGLCYGTRFDWISLGYSASGGECWNTIRALDVLESLPEVDSARIGATGNSGGGALSFYVGIADPRVRAVATSCGVTTPEYTIGNRNMLGHCDCIYTHNPFQRDPSEFAGLIAPRPLLFCYGIHDSLFNPAEYRSLVERTRRVYDLYGCAEHCRIFDYPGPHGYQPESVQEINRWFDAHVAGVAMPEQAWPPESELHEERALTIFNGKPPAPNRLDLIPELLSPSAAVELPDSAEAWPAIRTAAVERVRRNVFHTLLDQVPSVEPEMVGDWRNRGAENNGRMDYRADIDGMETWINMWNRCDRSGDVLVALAGPGESSRSVTRALGGLVADPALALIEPRGTGFTDMTSQHHQLQRAGVLAGWTPTMLLIQDLEALMPFIRRHPFTADKRIFLYGRGEAAVACLYHALLHEDIAGVALQDLPASHRDGGFILGILRETDIIQSIGLLAPRPVALIDMGQIRNKTWMHRAYARVDAARRLAMSSAGGLQSALEQLMRG